MKIHAISHPITTTRKKLHRPPPWKSHVPLLRKRALRVVIAVMLIFLAFLTASLLEVRAGSAIVVTRFGSPTRVLLTPGLAWRIPAPFETPVDVDLRVRSTSSGLQDVGTRDGLRILVQAWAIWKVKPDNEHILRFIRAVQNQPDEAARQIRTFVGSALETTTSNYALADIVNTDRSKIKISQLEQQFQDQLKSQLLNSYGIELIQVGVERLTLPAVTLNATVDRMRAERETIATERTAEGKRLAAEIHSGGGRFSTGSHHYGLGTT
ncbi:TPA: SPFH domain-containing protein [Salmonella enterica]